MAKKSEAKSRKQKLKVFRTPIGFHDAYVAAPSQKAALEAWGADSNLFAQGIAEEVTDATLMEAPLARPGEVVRKVRGSVEEHIAAADAAPRRKARAVDGEEEAPAKAAKSKPAKQKPRPSRVELDAAEEALEKLEKKQRKALRKLDERIQALEQERRELQRGQEAERDKLAGKRDRARSAYDKAMEAWRG